MILLKLSLNQFFPIQYLLLKESFLQQTFFCAVSIANRFSNNKSSVTADSRPHRTRWHYFVPTWILCNLLFRNIDGAIKYRREGPLSVGLRKKVWSTFFSCLPKRDNKDGFNEPINQFLAFTTAELVFLCFTPLSVFPVNSIAVG